MGNCLDRTLSDEAEDDIIDSNYGESSSSSSNPYLDTLPNQVQQLPSILITDLRSRTNRNRGGSDSIASDGGSSGSSSRHHHHHNNHSHHHHRHNRSHRNNSYTRINESSSSLASSLLSLSNSSPNQRILNPSNINNSNQINLFGTSFGSLINNAYLPSSQSSLPSSLQQNIPIGNNNNNAALSSSLQQQSPQQVFYLAPNIQRTADQLTEEEQIKLLKRMTLIQQLPSGSYDENKKNKECVICMIDFEVKDTIKYLPCMHTFHQSCIDAWLVRSLICPSCMEPVDAGLLSAYENE